MTFGEKLQRLRARAGLSQDQLAELLDVSRQAVSKWERNEAMPEAEKIVRISRGGPVGTDQAVVPEQGLSAGLGPGGLGRCAAGGYWIPHGQVLPDMPVPGL